MSLPGDKSLSHRALMLNALGEGTAQVRGLNPGADVASTAAALRALGVRILPEMGSVVIHGRGGRLRPAVDRIDCGNSGTTLRLLAGIVAAQPFTTTLDGDASLRGRPMRRIAEPLRALGARVDGPDHGETPPLILTGTALTPTRWELPVASAQVKSCVLLAGQAGGVEVTTVEPHLSRDHTERMLLSMGGDLTLAGSEVTLRPAPLRCVDVDVAGDPSAAALVCVAACALPGSQLRFPRTLINPTRVGFARVLERMGCRIDTESVADQAGEPVADLVVTAPDHLAATTVAAAEIPSLVDEVPALAAVAAFAEGVTRFCGIGELRVKESDRVRAVRDLLGAFGIQTREEGDDLEVVGGRPRRPAKVIPADDHRMSMAACGLALAASGEGIVVHGCHHADVSFPGFTQLLAGLCR